MGIKIYLSPSNQKNSRYAAGNTNEMEQCNRIAVFAQQALCRCGFEVRKAPMGQDIRTSIRESNAWGADLHLPIHTNRGGGSGTVLFVLAHTPRRDRLAHAIYQQVEAITPGIHDYGVRENPGMVELRCTNADAVFLECEFHDREDYAQWIIQHVEDLGEAICRGVCDAYGREYHKRPPSPPYFKVSAGSFSGEDAARNFCRALWQAGFLATVQRRGGPVARM